MSKIQKMLDAEIPVIPEESNEEAGSYSFADLTEEQRLKVQAILHGWEPVKMRRNALLADCDWTQVADVVLSLEEKAAWQEYRQALRDIPQTFANPEDVIWPVLPLGSFCNIPGVVRAGKVQAEGHYRGGHRRRGVGRV